MKRPIVIGFCILGVALAGGLYLATEANRTGANVTESQVDTGEPAMCVDEETVAALQQMSFEELEEWGRDNGIVPVTHALGRQGCDTTGPCSSGINCHRTSTCFGPFDSGLHFCGGVFCPDLAETVHFYRCLCTGDLCPLYEATRYYCA